jgi:hypothetical protein
MRLGQRLGQPGRHVTAWQVTTYLPGREITTSSSTSSPAPRRRPGDFHFSLATQSPSATPITTACGVTLHEIKMPSATGQNWEKYKQNFADDEEPEKKITPLTDEYVSRLYSAESFAYYVQRHPSVENVWSGPLCCRSEEAREADQGETAERR